MRNLWWLLFILPFGAYAASPVHEYQLKNGLKLLVVEDHRAPVVVSQIWYKVGSSYEHNGITGISHVLEHMMFKGTKKYGPGQFSKIIADNGGRENAFTSYDYTAYFQMLEKSRLAVSMEMEADRMHNLTLPPAEFKKELAVVKEERHMRTDDNPRALTQEQFDAVAYNNNPYKNPIIGWSNDLDNMTVDDVRAWYQRWYVPNNATLVIVGDVDPRAVYKLAQKYYGPIPAGKVIPDKPRRETPQLGPRRVVVRTPARVPYLIMGYKVPVLRNDSKEWEAYALDVLSGVLSAGRSARLPRILVRQKQIAVSADAGYDMYSLHNSLFEIDATPAPGHNVAELEQALQQQIKTLRDDKVSEAELDRVKAQVIASKVYQKDSMFYQGMVLGILESVGLSWKTADEYVDKIKAITPEQVQAVARKYLVDDHLTVAQLEPQSMDKQPRRKPHALPPYSHQ
ncbi:MAG: pitrilysin family protein [Gammaproteobacteria bacterium]|jgi:zinc protease